MNTEIVGVLNELTAIRADIQASPDALQPRLDQVHPNYRKSARNLLHYLALRRRDLRPLQHRLAALGLSSLGRAESHVLPTVDAVLKILNQLAGTEAAASPEAHPVDFGEGQRLLAEHTNTLLGPSPVGRLVRIMVTMPTEAADDYVLVHDLLRQGMNCMRINCAHDDPQIWGRMIQHLRRAEGSLGRTCKVVMDLAGPKLRTGPLEPGPAVVKIRPRRDEFGRILSEAKIWLTSADSPCKLPTRADASLPLPAPWLARLKVGDRVKFIDARDARRTMTILDVTDRGCWAELGKSAYLVNGTVLHHVSTDGKKLDRDATISDLPSSEGEITLQTGDLITVTRNLNPGRAATHDSDGQILTPATIGCSIPEVFNDTQPGESIWFDDGKIGGVVEKIEPESVEVRITHTRPEGDKLRGDKGINLPDSNLHLVAMTESDITNLSFVAHYADIVELSFANSAHDVQLLHEYLDRLRHRPPAIVLKIETRRGFENLPDMLLTAMRAPSCGVMIARGDLAVECGFERLAEVQEEILWICEAAHVPVIWATQVLETLAKEGMPSRAEITDAAMGHRAECVMLNKGPHMVTAVRVLDDILQRMQTHQAKKGAMLRELHLAHGLSDATSVQPLVESMENAN